MPKYAITMKGGDVRRVEANSKEEAERKARNLYRHCQGKTKAGTLCALYQGHSGSHRGSHDEY